MPVVLVDSGPLVAAFDPNDRFHTWAANTLRSFAEPRNLVTCDAVITEVTYIFRDATTYMHAALEAFERGLVRTSFDLQAEISRVRALMLRYNSVPMSLADGCLVRMSELQADVVVWTLDSDFTIYRRHGRQRIPTLMPR